MPGLIQNTLSILPHFIFMVALKLGCVIPTLRTNEELKTERGPGYKSSNNG